MQFDFWTRWGIDLPDAEFAAAWLALGIAAGADPKPAATEGYLGLPLPDPASATAHDLQELAHRAVGQALMAAHKHAQGVRWRFPDPLDTVDADGHIALTRIAPGAWAQAWTAAASLVPEPPRLRISHAPAGEPHLPWLRLLSEARPPVAAVSMAWSAPNPQLVLAWPLRLGTVTDAGEAVIAATLAQWPSTRLARRVAIDRANANCDVLVHSGPVATLLAALLALPFRCKANLVVIAAADDAGMPTVGTRLQAIAAETSASGTVLWTRAAAPNEAADALNAFVNAFSHDQPLDCALHAAAQDGPVGDASAWLTDALADTQLRAFADRLTARVQALPAGTGIRLDAVRPAGWVHSVAPITTRAGGAATVTQPGYTDVDALRLDARALRFDHESGGASDLADMAAAVDEAQTTADTDARRAARFLQQQSFVRQHGRYTSAAGGLVAGKPALVRVRIGPAEGKWQSTASEFPAQELPPGHLQWRLTVWLTEPRQLPQPLRGAMVLPVDGASSECEFRFTPQLAGPFDGRITVLHRGRVLQTAALRGGVIADGAAPDANAMPVLADIAPVRQQLGDLEGRRQFDMAFVVNHTAQDAPRSVALSATQAWTADVTDSLEIVKDLNVALSRVAKSVKDYEDGLDGESGRALLVDLAKKGAWLAINLVHDEAGRQPDVAHNEYIQIVSTRTDATVPFEFIYDHKVPHKDAVVCAHWREALAQGQCPQDCAGGDAKRVCPLGFWGLRKVIERQLVRPGPEVTPRKVILQAEPGQGRTDLPLGGTALFASSARVPASAQKLVTDTLAARLGQAPQTAANWDGWMSIVEGAHPHLLLALPHTDGSGANVTLEIGDSTLEAIEIAREHVQPSNESARPLVALLGCDTAGTADDYGKHVAVFRDRGAAIVIGTIATVFGEHAARVGALLAQELLPNGAPPQRLGEAMRALKRRALLDGLLMPLCVVAYGDADWRLVRDTTAH